MVEENQWDAFRSKPRAVREATQKSNWTLYALQCVKFSIYLFAHLCVLIAALVSKAVILLLATNFDNRKVQSEEFHKKCGINHLPVRDHHENECAVLAALFLIQVLPDVGCIAQCCYRMMKLPMKDHSIISIICLLETCRSAGLAILVFMVFPELDLTRCMFLMCSVLFMPYFVDLIGRFHKIYCSQKSVIRRIGLLLKTIPKALLALVLFSGTYIWRVFKVELLHSYWLFAGLLLYAIGNWESWVDVKHANGPLRKLFQVKYGLKMLSNECRILVCLMRITVVGLVVAPVVDARQFISSDFVHLVKFPNLGQETLNIYFLTVGVVIFNFLIRCTVRFLAAMKMRLLNLLHPAFIITVAFTCLPNLICHHFPICKLNILIRPFGLNWQFIRWTSTTIPFSDYYIMGVWLLLYIFWSYKFVAGKRFKMVNEVIDAMPILLNGFQIENSLVVFRYAIGKKEIIVDCEDETVCKGKLKIINSEIDKTVTVYVCATMWHETKNEMVQMIISIMKLDEEHAIRLAEKDSKDLIKFKLEVHIFFDDAWVNDVECGRIPNEYFKLLFELLMELTKNPENSDARTRILANTSYGGRLVVRLAAGTLLFVHLKDKQLIRHKKRWSQVMYMYYLLGHRIMDSHLSVEDRQLQADNTYILAIDGDSKFEPEAVIKLLHLMNTKSDIGCACGRIHPIGNGVMVWYQKFEYAIAHWFQKAAEHVFGCVLCAPGCFSLFRASALMDDNIMHKYTKTAVEPRHYVQYDQGEDRWLSTLMLKQGYRIEYAAGADAETYAPEGFEEFFNQRRRWTPSSVANTLDLLADYKLASQNNNSISKLYILYQMLVMGFSILGPAIIFTMLVYAQVAAFAVDSFKVLMYNAVPVCVFILCCFCFDSSIQLLYAKLASIIYAFVMLAVLIATAQQIVLETIFSPTSMFVLFMVLIFLVAAFIHPKEFTNIIFGAIFFLMIPSTYVFLSLYSLVNLNVINWGTREAVSKAIGKPVDKDSIAERWLRRLGIDDENSVICRLCPCLKPSTVQSDPNVRVLERKLERQERILEELQQKTGKSQGNDHVSMLKVIEERKKEVVSFLPSRLISSEEQKDPLVAINALMQTRRGLWMDCEYLQCCDRGQLKQSEERFWDQLIDKYLRPIELTQKEQGEVADGLVSLRNRIAFSIIILNGLLVLAIFLLQRHKDVLSIQVTPYDGFQWTKMNETTGKFEKTNEALKVDPLGMGIIFFLFGILIVQTIGMFIHRLNTLVEALHETSEFEELTFTSSRIKSKKSVLGDARQMIDTIKYDKAHGADGYVRSGKMERKALNNVLYKLQREDENVPRSRHPKRI